uniref:5',3'-nucleotidase, mitochondrial n=1 Tax=Laticauda laticaudata TaxID=8630 RepID=A0A8C5RE55_LATLA
MTYKVPSNSDYLLCAVVCTCVFSFSLSPPPTLQDKAISIWESKNFFMELNPLPGAVEALKEMAELEATEVFICTSPIKKYRYCPYEKFAWIEKHFGHEFLEHVILTRDKTIVSGHVLIDDRPDIIGKVGRAGAGEGNPWRGQKVDRFAPCWSNTTHIFTRHLSFLSQEWNGLPPGSTCFSPPATTSICSSQLLATGCTHGLMIGRPSWKASELAEAWRVLSKASKEWVWLPEAIFLSFWPEKEEGTCCLPWVWAGMSEGRVVASNDSWF